MVNSYPKIRQTYDRDSKYLLGKDVIIEEKIDGSQGTIAVLDSGIKYFSKNTQIDKNSPHNLFKSWVVNTCALKLPVNYVIRGEVISNKRHNVITYDRVPKYNFVIFDVAVIDESGNLKYLNRSEKEEFAATYGFEIVPCYYSGVLNSFDELNQYLNNKSILGDVPIEGVVAKHYSETGDIQTVKLVSSEYREVKKVKSSPQESKFIIDQIIEALSTPARYHKSIQHTLESEGLKFQMSDVPSLIRNLDADVREEDTDVIKEMLYTHFISGIKKGVISGMAEFYKEYLKNRGDGT